MPLPLIGIIAAGIAVGKGALDHMEASQTNDLARRIQEDAQEKYETEKANLEKVQENVKDSLIDLGTSKKNVLEHSFPRFLRGYERIKNIDFKDSIAINEISKYTVDEKNIKEMKELSAEVISSMSAGANGAATGMLISLAASGSVGILTGGLYFSGTLLSCGMVGGALGMAGSTIAASLAATPLAVLVAPAVLFSGLSAKGNADKNYDKANEYEAEVNKAVEEMKTSTIVCQAIIDRSEMFDDLLKEIDLMFYVCALKLDIMTSRKVNEVEGRNLQLEDFSDDEINLIAVTRSLAGAIKSILDTPILSNDGNLTYESQNVGESLNNSLPKFKEQYSLVTS